MKNSLPSSVKKFVTVCRRGAYLLVPLLMTVIMYLPTLNYPFVWDDELLLKNNPTIADISNIKYAFTESYLNAITNTNNQVPFYRPLSLGLLYVEHHLFGDNPAGYHVVHLSLHLLSVFLIILFVRHLLRVHYSADDRAARWAAAVAGLFFSATPYSVDSVLFLTNVGDLMAFPALLLTLAMFVKYNESKRFVYAIGICLLTALSIFSKETGGITPVLLIAVAIFYFRRVSKESIIAFAASALAVICFFILRAFVLTDVPPTKINELVTQLPKDFFPALRWTIFPHPLSLFEPLTSTPDWDIIFILSTLGCALYATVIVIYRKRQPIVAGALSVWALLIAPALVATYHTNHLAPRYLYAPAFGLALILGYLFFKGTRIIKAIYIPFFICLLLFSVIRLHAWSSNQALWEREVAIHPNEALALYNLGITLNPDTEYKRAMVLYSQAIENAKKSGEFQTLANAYVKLAWHMETSLRDEKRAFSLYQEALKVQPNFLAWIGIGRIHARYDHNYAKALVAFKQAEKLRPNDFTVLTNIEMALASLSRFDDALKYNDKMLKMTSNLPGARRQVEKKRQIILKQRANDRKQAPQ